MAKVSGQSGQKHYGPVFQISIKILIGPHTAGKKRMFLIVRDLPCKRYDRLFWSPGHLGSLFRSKILIHILFHEIKYRSDLNPFIVQSRHFILPFKGGVGDEVISKVISGHNCSSICFGIPNNIISPFSCKMFRNELIPMLPCGWNFGVLFDYFSISSRILFFVP